ncbi:hypothetical protein BMW23_1112 [Bodo saltans virus]|uniref:Ribosomal RNA methyltransferase FtsJ domain-containing protein n=1 Tax=Bodo saltans virus TaxID=2024608 RepID=A0A2H4UWE4_9VIRU|nr:hypothetical protein QJ851_gp1092 [Bodo saltans virus]ATZ81155.1 hypothetical protein BMW23_1112 [Bodo saltans virus]
MNIISSRYSFDIKQQKNTYSYYNGIIVKYLQQKYTWFNQISKKDLDNINDTISKIKSKQSKDNIEPYYNIYNYYLNQYEHIFNNKSFIDCGCAPGGFFKFASENNMIGCGITLQSVSNNMALELKYDKFDVIYGDLLDENFILSLDTKIKNKVDFVNIGAVFYDKTDKKNDNMSQKKLFLNQMYIAKHYLKNNGSIMFVFDVFMTLYNFICIALIFIKHKINIHIIPVQPEFKTTQVYILAENIIFDDLLFQDIYLYISQSYIPILKKKNYINIVDNVFSSPYFDIESFKNTYYIKYIMLSKMFECMKLDSLNRSKYNFNYLKYNDSLFIFEKSKLYNSMTLPLIKIINEKRNKIRNKFIKKNNITVDNENNIDDTYQLNLHVLLEANTTIKKIYFSTS